MPRYVDILHPHLFGRECPALPPCGSNRRQWDPRRIRFACRLPRFFLSRFLRHRAHSVSVACPTLHTCYISCQPFGLMSHLHEFRRLSLVWCVEMLLKCSDRPYGCRIRGVASRSMILIVPITYLRRSGQNLTHPFGTTFGTPPAHLDKTPRFGHIFTGF